MILIIGYATIDNTPIQRMNPCRTLLIDGKVSRIEQCRNGSKPYWYSWMQRAEPIKKEDVDWKEFLMDRPMRPFDGKLAKEEKPIPPVETADHFLDWLQCMRSRKVCNAPIEAGYNHCVPALMAMKAFDTGVRQVYDAEKREFRDG